MSVLLGALLGLGQFSSQGAPPPEPLQSPLPPALAPQSPSDPDQSEKLFEQAVACQHGEGELKSPEKARDLYLASSQGGNTKAMLNLGILLMAGDGVPQDQDQGFRWIRKAADAGDVKALYSCALILRSGVGVPKDPALAVVMMSKAAEMGYPLAELDLGKDLRDGTNGVSKDPKKAAELLLKAAMAGHDGAAFTMSELYASGEGVPKDNSKSHEWMEKAGQLGNPNAQFEKAHKLMVLQGPAAAYPWAKLAHDAGYVPANGMILEITGMLTPEQIKKGDREAERIKSAYPSLP